LKLYIRTLPFSGILVSTFLSIEGVRLMCNTDHLPDPATISSTLNTSFANLKLDAVCSPQTLFRKSNRKLAMTLSFWFAKLEGFFAKLFHSPA
jgi:hypothetical protein